MTLPQRPARLLLAALLLLAPVSGREQLADRLRFYSQWNDDYLYVAARMEDINVVGKHVTIEPTNLVSEDDDLEIFIQAGPDPASPAGKPGQALNDRCFWLAMSAAGGLSFRHGDASTGKDWLPSSPLVQGTPFRQELKVLGTLNDPTDADLGWEVEAAIPWRAIGIEKPQPNEVMRFNLVRNLRGEADARWSWSPLAAAPKDDLVPANWGQIAFRAAEGGSAAWIGPADKQTAICARVSPPTIDARGRTVVHPLIDGVVSPGEWPELYRTDELLVPARLTPLTHLTYAPPPAKPAVLPPGATFQPPALPPRLERGQYSGERLIFATYRLDYQDDPRQPGVAPFGVRAADGSCLLVNQPLSGLGPWFSGLRVGWHEEQLRAAAQAGIDVLLVRFDGDRASEARYSLAALRSLAQAAVELQARHEPVPRLGVLVPAEAITGEAGPQADLTQPVTQEGLYRIIRDFYRTIPPESWALVCDGPRQAVVVGLDRPPRELRATDSFLAYNEGRFAGEFGLDLLWLGSATWARRGISLDAQASFDGGEEPLVSTGGRIPTASIGPGCDDNATAADGNWRSRMQVATFRNDFRSTVKTPYSWLLLDSWNDFHRGDNLAPSRQYGDAHVQALKLAALQFNSPDEKPWVAKFRRLEVPARIAAGAKVECPVTVFNAGVRPWRYEDGISVSYRWYEAEPTPVLDREGRPVVDAQKKPVMRLRPVAEDGHSSLQIAPQESYPEATTLVPVQASDDDGKPLPPGRYRLRFDVVAGSTTADVPITDDKGKPLYDKGGKPRTRKVTAPNWLSLLGDPTFDVVVEVVAPDALPQGASILAAGLPARLETGQKYPLHVTVRNDGTQPWSEGVRLAARFEQVDHAAPWMAETDGQAGRWQALGSLVGNLNAEQKAFAERLERKEEFKPRKEIAAGEVVSVPVTLPVVDDDGQPLRPNPGAGASWRVSLGVVDAAGRLIPLGRPYGQSVQLVDRDYGTSFQAIKAPDLMRAGQPAACTVAMVNTGHRAWPKDATALTYHWYTWDGVEQRFDNPRTPLPETVEPGHRAEVTVNVEPPPSPGGYQLVFDLVHPGERYGAQQPSTSGREVMPQPVAVVRGTTRPVELSPLFNVMVSSFGPERKAGDFDGQGQSLPAELLPPGFDDVAGGLYPSGYLGPTVGVPAWQRGIGFWYGPRPGHANAVRPAGQIVDLGGDNYRRIHLLAAAAGPDDVTCHFGVVPAGQGKPIELAPVTITSWNQPARHGELLGFRTPYRYVAGEIDPGPPVWLHHVVINVDPNQALRTLVLPTEPKLRILAITMEPAPPATAGPAR